MRTVSFILVIFAVAVFTSCEVQSGIAKKSLEQFEPSPTPTPSSTPTPVAIDPADAVTVDESASGPLVSFNGPETKKNLKCEKFNRVMINQDNSEISITGACGEIVINGSSNKIKADAFSIVVFNGDGNTLTHTKYVNAKHPRIVDNTGGNSVEKVTAGQKPAAE